MTMLQQVSSRICLAVLCVASLCVASTSPVFSPALAQDYPRGGISTTVTAEFEAQTE